MNSDNKFVSFSKYAVLWLMLVLIASLQVALSAFDASFAILILSSIAVFAIISTYFINKYYKTVVRIFAVLVIAELFLLFLM